MLKYALKRILQFVPTIIGITLLMFLVLNFIPGNAAFKTGGKLELEPEVMEQLKKDWGLDKPLHVRYLSYMKNLAKGDLGKSFLRRYEVKDIIGERFYATMKLAVCAMVIALALGIPLGFISALKQGTWFDTLSILGAVSGVSIPQFWLGLMLMYVFCYMFNLLPSSGYGDGSFLHLILPAITLGVSYIALLARTTRAAVIEILSADYVRTARSKGISIFSINGKHVFKNALILILTTAGLQFGSLIGQTVIVEKIFSWPGIGSLLVESIFQRDIPVAQGCILTIIFVFLIVNLVVDLLYSIIDPRITYQ